MFENIYLKEVTLHQYYVNFIDGFFNYLFGFVIACLFVSQLDDKLKIREGKNKLKKL